MKQNLVRHWLLGSIVLGLLGPLVLAQDAPKADTPPAESAPPPAVSSPSVNPIAANSGPSAPAESIATSDSRPSAGMDEMLKMLKAGVSKDVIKTYIETAQVVTPPTATEIVSLKEHGLPDDLTMALIKRGAELSARANQTAATNAAPAKVTGTTTLEALAAAVRRGQINSGRLDPESYDYFQYYYLYPRTLQSANERLCGYPPFAAYPPYGPGLYSRWGFGPSYFGPPYRGPW